MEVVVPGIWAGVDIGKEHHHCVVINDNRIVQGRLRRDRLDTNDDRAVEDVMEPGPATVRADADLTGTTERMQRRGVTTLIVSTPDGALLGALRTEPRPA